MINDNENEIKEANEPSENTDSPEKVNSEPVETTETVEVTETAEAAEAETEKEPVTAPEEPPKETYAFRWTYSDQYAYDRSEATLSNNKKRREKTKHIGVYIAVMLVAFSFVLTVLALSLNFDDMGKWFADDPAAEMSVSDIVEKGMPSTVAIYALKSTDTYGAGSGFVISDYGYIVTNYHVVQNAVSVMVMDSSGYAYSASVIGYNATDDIAVLYSEECKLPAVKLGDSSKLVLGETLVAIGTPGGEECAFSVSNGIVSGLNRAVSGKRLGMIQTNAPLNPGNSGGPLFDSQGNLVGIVTMKYTFTSVTDGGQYLPYEGMSFALPINGVLNEIKAMIESDLASPKIGVTAVAVEGEKDYFYYADKNAVFPRVIIDGADYYMDGVGDNHLITAEMRNDPDNMIFTADTTGILIVGITKGLGAEGKLQAGDIVVTANGSAIGTVADFAAVCSQLSAGQKITVTFMRNGEMRTEVITLMTKLDMLSALG